ncbi:MAG: MSMEG_0567/sll0787 family protein [Actinomycetota bacterium]|nr:MSMEG_0567/sll0787 family protein [Actinomycetota bacterium]
MGILTDLGGPRRPPIADTGRPLVVEADAEGLRAHRELRRQVFVERQGLFADHDRDELDDDPNTVVLIARAGDGTVLGGVRLAPCADPGLGWWAGSRLVVAPGAPPRVGAALVRAACSRAENAGALRFDATVQADKERFFTRLGWVRRRTVELHGAPHVEMTWPVDRLARLAAAKAVIGQVLGEEHPGGDGWVGDDGVPVDGSDLVAACDAIVPAMVERDPWWAGWCSVLVNVNDVAAMGARPVGLLDALAAGTTSAAQRVAAGLRAAADTYGVPVLGGHTQIGVPAALAVTMLGRTERPVPAGGGEIGDVVSLSADLAGGWRPGYAGRQWDSTTHRSPAELRSMVDLVARHRPHAAKDVSMAGLVGTLAMLAEASGCGAVLDVADVPRPEAVGVGDWFACFPGFAMITTDAAPLPADAAAPATTAACGRLVGGGGVELRWSDGVCTPAVAGPVTGLGPAAPHPPSSRPGHDGPEEPA